MGGEMRIIRITTPIVGGALACARVAFGPQDACDAQPALARTKRPAPGWGPGRAPSSWVLGADLEALRAFTRIK
jgi:hypothetical protein